jgi:hypothetical protein
MTSRGETPAPGRRPDCLEFPRDAIPPHIARMDTPKSLPWFVRTCLNISWSTVDDLGAGVYVIPLE